MDLESRLQPGLALRYQLLNVRLGVRWHGRIDARGVKLDAYRVPARAAPAAEGLRHAVGPFLHHLVVHAAPVRIRAKEEQK